MQKNWWLIKCKNTPETIDRIVMPFRKRGMKLSELKYASESEDFSQCEVVFMEESSKAKSIYNNLIRLVDIEAIDIKG